MRGGSKSGFRFKSVAGGTATGGATGGGSGAPDGAGRRGGKRKVPAVNCAFDELVATEKVRPNLRNPNRHSADQRRLYAKILFHQGWRKPIVVSNQSGFIVTGEGAWLTARDEGWPSVPVDFQDFATPADEYAHLLADNRLPQLAEVDQALMDSILSEDIAGKLDLELTGALLEESEDVTGKPEFPITSKLNEQYDYVLIFCENATDFVFLQTLCGVRVERSYKKTGIGIGRCVPFSRFLDSIRKNNHSINVAVDVHDDPPAGKGVQRVRAGEPGGRLQPGRGGRPGHHPSGRG